MDSTLTRWQANRYSILLAALILFFLTAPLYQFRLNAVLVQSVTVLIFALILISALRIIDSKQRSRPVLSILALLVLVLLATAMLTDSTSLMTAFYALNLLFLATVAVLTIARLMGSRSADYETIAASLCGYILLIMLWANTYSLIDSVAANSFTYALAAPETGQLMRFGFGDASLSLYYSFVTMTTLGYGDVLPVTAMARVLAATQAFVGQVYIAVLVARLVGLEIAERASAAK